jgi:hypothetical protein
MNKTWQWVRGVVELLLGLYMALAGMGQLLIAITSHQDLASKAGSLLGSGILAIFGAYVFTDGIKVIKKLRSGSSVTL